MGNKEFKKVESLKRLKSEEWRVKNLHIQLWKHLFNIDFDTSPLSTLQSPLFKKAFTLAEVLITLGIIGVVAAMTIPTLIQHHKKQVIETRLEKFYSTINQAVQRAEVDFGDKKLWYQGNLSGAQLDDEGNIIEGSSESEKWFKKYLAPYLQTVKIETLQSRDFLVYFPDGSALKSSPTNSRTWSFYPSNPKKCIETNVNNENIGKCVFLFNFFPTYNSNYLKDKGFEPYKVNWDGNESTLFEGCEGRPITGTNHGYCTALIQYNGWKIPKNYPVKY